MRLVLASLIAILLAIGASTVFAGGGLPQVGQIQVGPYAAALHNDSPTLITGANALTVEIPDLPAGSRVSLSLDGPDGTSVVVPLKTVRVLGGHSDGGHGGGDAQNAEKTDDHGGKASAGHGAAQTGDSHSAADSGGHGAAVVTLPRIPGMPKQADHPHETATFLARGTVKIPSTGTWMARLVVLDEHGTIYAGEASLDAERGGPNRLYIGVVGSLMVGALVYGAAHRLRRPTRAAKAK